MDTKKQNFLYKQIRYNKFEDFLMIILEVVKIVILQCKSCYTNYAFNILLRIIY